MGTWWSRALAALALCVAALPFPAVAAPGDCAAPTAAFSPEQLKLHASFRDENTGKKRRPDPVSYLPAALIEAHLGEFASGATYFVTQEILDWRGREWLGYDDGTQFVMPRTEADRLVASARGDVRVLEAELGIPQGRWSGKTLVRIDIPAPRELNLRMPSGNEAGANECWLPGGLTPSGRREAVVDRIPLGRYIESPLWNLPPLEATTESSTSTASAY